MVAIQGTGVVLGRTSGPRPTPGHIGMPRYRLHSQRAWAVTSRPEGSQSPSTDRLGAVASCLPVLGPSPVAALVGQGSCRSERGRVQVQGQTHVHTDLRAEPCRLPLLGARASIATRMASRASIKSIKAGSRGIPPTPAVRGGPSLTKVWVHVAWVEGRKPTHDWPASRGKESSDRAPAWPQGAAPQPPVLRLAA